MKILTSEAVVCLIVTSLCGNFGISLFTTCLPTYMKEVLNFDIKSVKIKSPETKTIKNKGLLNLK